MSQPHTAPAPDNSWSSNSNVVVIIAAAAGVTVTGVEAKAYLGTTVFQATFHSKGVTYVIKFLFSL